MQELARSAGVWLLLGGFPETGRTAARIRNSPLLLDPDGLVVGRLPEDSPLRRRRPGRRRFRESDAIEPGEGVGRGRRRPGAGSVSASATTCGSPSSTARSRRAGARIVAVPSAFTLETGKDHWHVLLRARAIENQVYVLAPAQVGGHGPTRRSYGHALVVDPWGSCWPSAASTEGFALARLDFAYQDKLRAALPALTHRRL